MRYSVGMKFIAIVLCAAALLGAVASGAGIIGMTALGLYSKTVEQIQEEAIQSAASNLAHFEARRYCASNLGGCPEGLLNETYGSGSHRYELNYDHVSYAIRDAEGNLLAGYGDLTAETSQKTYTIPVKGKYMHLISATPASQLEAERMAEKAKNIENAVEYRGDNGSYYVCAVPEEGTPVNEISLWDTPNRDRDGAAILQADIEGFLFWDKNGELVFRSLGNDFIPDLTVYAAELKLDDETVFYASDPDGVGRVYCDEKGRMTFRAQVPTAEPMPEETAAQTTEATVPATEPQTQPTEAVTEPPQEPEEGGGEEGAEPDEGGEEYIDPEGGEEYADPEGGEEPVDGEGSSASAMPEEDGEPEGEAEPAPEAEPTENPEPTGEPAPAQTLPVVQPSEPAPTAATEPVPAGTEPLIIDGKPLSEYEVTRTSYFDDESNEDIWVEYVYANMPPITVEVYTEAGALREETTYAFLGMLQPYRNDLFLLLAGCVLLFAVFAVYLCCAAGRKPKVQQVHAQGLNRLPLDVYLGVAGLGCVGLVIIAVEGGQYFLRQSLAVGCATGAAVAYAACVLVVGFLFAAVAQFKTPGGYWWRNLLSFRLLVLAVDVCRWCWRLAIGKLLPWSVNVIKGLWRWTVDVLTRLIRWLKKWTHCCLTLLPVTWQWMLGGAVLLLLPLFGFFTESEGLTVLCVVADVVIILYGANCFGTLMNATKKMSKGDLNSQVDDKKMVGAFKEFAGDLNDLAGVAVVAAKKQLKSERMKTELITNVSHDIKTPLTSIINYVDLLQKPHTQEEQEQYLEVLSRQSLRLKKLIEDLMEMSKASTGNMTVDLQTVDAVESVNQALGEFSDKLEKAQLFPVFRHNADSVLMMADGRLVWRVLSNLLINAVKYAMPGTRLYVDLVSLDGKVTISLKNISREELNVPADELMERFVRGDDSRNTEGSGLGLNIAKSLMELQKGELQLLVDGDLFKVTLVFPAVE